MHKKNLGFTLIELLVVIAVIGIIATVVLINVRSARENARINRALSFEKSIARGLSTSLYAEYHLDSSYGSGPVNTVDSSGLSNDGTIAGTVNFLNEASGQCVIGGCIEIDGNATNFLSPSSPPNTTLHLAFTQRTFAAWINMRSFSGTPKTLYNEGGSNGMRVLHVTDKLILDVNLGGGALEITAPYTELNTYHHVAGSFDNGILTLYIDGAIAIQGDTGLSSIGSHGSEPFIGKRFDGYMDEVRIFEGSPSAAQVQQLYAQGLADRRNVAYTAR